MIGLVRWIGKVLIWYFVIWYLGFLRVFFVEILSFGFLVIWCVKVSVRFVLVCLFFVILVFRFEICVVEFRYLVFVSLRGVRVIGDVKVNW